jgi:hypothetical protein
MGKSKGAWRVASDAARRSGTGFLALLNSFDSGPAEAMSAPELWISLNPPYNTVDPLLNLLPQCTK